MAETLSPLPGDELQDQDELSDKMSFLEHLDELRTRLIYSIIAVGAGFLSCLYFNRQIFDFVAAPLRQFIPADQKLVFFSPTESFGISLKVSFVAGIFVASPFLLWQLWLFISPGLYRREKTYALPFLFASTLLFVSGGAFAYYIALPPTLKFLLYFNPSLTYVPKAADFFSLVTTILLAMGAIFQLPVLIGFLSLFGIVTPRFLIHNFKYAFLLAFIIAAVVSPTGDAMSLLIFAFPLIALYFVSIGVSYVFQFLRKRQARH